MKNFAITIFFLGVSLSINAQTAHYPNMKDQNYKVYITKAGDTLKVGDRVEIGLPYGADRYTFIFQGGVNAGTVLTGKTVKITKLKATGNDDIGYTMFALFKGFGLLPVEINLENALRVEEVILMNEL